MFSNRLPDDFTPNFLGDLVDKSGLPQIDLTESNPTKCDFKSYSYFNLKDFNFSNIFPYHPNPQGNKIARESLANYLTHQGRITQAENIFFTSGTSEAYSFIFKLLANPMDKFMVPIPSYPLLEYLLQLESNIPVFYKLDPNQGWKIDLDYFTQLLLSNDIKGLIYVSPNNPTGNYLNYDEFVELEKIFTTANKNIPIIIDEVFYEYARGVKPNYFSSKNTLIFRLGGLSKLCGLPQLKISWIILEGPRELVDQAKIRLEFIADTFLSVNIPIQIHLPKLLTVANKFQDEVSIRTNNNYQRLKKILLNLAQEKKISILDPQGGWYGIIEIHGMQPYFDVKICWELYQKHKILIHPGDFYNFFSGNFLVFSLLIQEDQFDKAISLLTSLLYELL
jgi:aspartate/methionine/tyrosine aminotransferase